MTCHIITHKKAKCERFQTKITEQQLADVAEMGWIGRAPDYDIVRDGSVKLTANSRCMVLLN